MRSDELDDVPADVVERLRVICAALPEIHEQRTVWAHDFLIRRSSVVGASSVDGTVLCSVRADPDEIDALVASGHPYFRTGQGNRLGVVLDGATDWDELRELVTESSRLLAPRALAREIEGFDL